MGLVKWMVDGNPPIMRGFLKKIRRAYLHGKKWTLYGMGEVGLREG